MLFRRFLKPTWRGALLGVCCAFAAWGLSFIPLIQQLEDRLQDGCFPFRGTRKSQAKVVLVLLDSASLEALQKPMLYLSPELAEVVAFLKHQGAAAIGLDVMIPETYLGLPELQRDGAGDAARLGEAIQEVGNVVLPEIKFGDRWLSVLPQWRFKSFLNPGPNDLAFVNWTEDGDYFLRSQQLVVHEKDRQRRQFALALTMQATGWELREENDEIFLGGRRLPLTHDRLRINYVGPPGTLPTVNLGEVLAAARGERACPIDLHEAIVIVGSGARDQQDFHATPFASSAWLALYGGPWGLMSGSEIHGQLAATLLDRAFIRTPGPIVDFLFLLAVGVFLGRSFARLSLSAGLLLFAGHHLVWRGAGLGLFSLFDLRLSILPMLLLGLLVFGITILQRWRLLRLMLGVVKSENIACLLEQDPSQMELQGEDRTVTLLFADIRSFTAFAEKHTAREVVALLNAYFGAIVPAIEAQGGTLNQYMGDGIMVIFGAPQPQSDQASRAVRAAVDTVRCVHQRKKEWAALGFPDMRIGVGVHTGRVVVGTVGSPHRLDYTAIGDTTNSASRIESANKIFGTEILISDQTYQALSVPERDSLGCRAETREVEVKGKELPLCVHSVEVDSERADIRSSPYMRAE